MESTLFGRILMGAMVWTAISCTNLLAQEAGSINERLDAARTEYANESERLRMELLASLEAKENAARKVGNKALVDRIKQEREAFELSDELPTVVSSSGYKRGLVTARSKLITVLKAGLKESLKAKQDAEADGLQSELDELQAEQPEPTPAKNAKAGKEPTVVAAWAHEVVIDGKVNSRITYQMYSNGRINAPDGRATWRRQGLLLILRIPDQDAPGGAWVDVCKLAADGRSYTGKNQKGYTIRGLQLVPDKQKAN